MQQAKIDLSCLDCSDNILFQTKEDPLVISKDILDPEQLTVNEAMQSDRHLFSKQDSLTLEKFLQLMNEILGGMKVLKLYAWEPSFINQIGAIRNDEIKVMKKAAYIQAFMSFFWTTAPFMVGPGAFTTYLFINGGQELTAQKAFVTLLYLNLM
mgnify:CR=1 FL=1